MENTYTDREYVGGTPPVFKWSKYELDSAGNTSLVAAENNDPSGFWAKLANGVPAMLEPNCKRFAKQMKKKAKKYYKLLELTGS